MKPSILYVGGFEMPDKNAAAHQVLNNAKILKHIGYNVLFCGISHNMKWNDHLQETIEDTFYSFPTAYPQSTSQWIKSMLSISPYKAILENDDSIQAVIAYNLHAIPLALLIRYCHKKRIKIISNISEWYDNPFSLKPVSLIKFIDTNVSMRLVQKHTDGLIVVSSFLYNYYSRYCNNVMIMPPLVDTNDTIWKNAEGYSQRNGIKYVYAGGIEPNNKKDLLLPIIKSFSLIRDENFKFTIIGLTRERLISEFPEIEPVIKFLGSKLEFLGRLPHSTCVKYLLESDYTIFVRERTRKNMAGFPTKFVEGWTSGINIIASDVSDIANYFPNDGYSILMKNNDFHTIYESIQFSMKPSLKQLQNNRRNGLINNPFDYNNWIDPIDTFFSTVLGKNI